MTSEDLEYSIKVIWSTFINSWKSIAQISVCVSCKKEKNSSFLGKLCFQYVLNPEHSFNELSTKSQRCKMCQGLLKVIFSLSNSECFTYNVLCIITPHMSDWLHVNISLGWVSLRSLSEGLMTPQLRFTEIRLNTPISQVIK